MDETPSIVILFQYNWGQAWELLTLEQYERRKKELKTNPVVYKLGEKIQ